MCKRAVAAVFVIFSCLLGAQCSPGDTDGDGVPNAEDRCANTPICAVVDANGCPSDDDDDGVANGCDECRDTPAGDTVYANGCSTGGGVRPRCVGPDLRAREIEYSLVDRLSDTRATIQIKGIAENFGLADYVSGAGQQGLQLWEDGVMVAHQDFLNLAVDATVTLEYQRGWNTADEFLPTRYQFIVTYDPDILDDGNPINDDCRPTNNSILRSAAGINSLFD